MAFDHAWELFSKIVWPILLMYAAYLHKELTSMMAKFDVLQREFFGYKAEANRTFVTQDTMSALETKILSGLNRLDDKLTRVLESREHR